MRRRLGQVLLSCAMTLVGCSYDTVAIDSTSKAASVPTPTEDQNLVAFSGQLAGSWRGQASWASLFSLETEFLELQWTPDSSAARSGELLVCPIVPERPCTRGPGSLLFGYNLHDIASDGSISGVLEWKQPDPEVEGYIKLQLIPQ